MRRRIQSVFNGIFMVNADFNFSADIFIPASAALILTMQTFAKNHVLM